MSSERRQTLGNQDQGEDLSNDGESEKDWLGLGKLEEDGRKSEERGDQCWEQHFGGEVDGVSGKELCLSGKWKLVRPSQRDAKFTIVGLNVEWIATGIGELFNSVRGLLEKKV